MDIKYYVYYNFSNADGDGNVERITRALFSRKKKQWKNCHVKKLIQEKNMILQRTTVV